VITGLAASVASVPVFGVGLPMAAGLFEAAVAPLAGAALLLAAAVFMTLHEPDAAPGTADDDGPLGALAAPILTDAQLRLVVAARAAQARPTGRAPQISSRTCA
jgi:hypothetical protein